MSAKHSTGAPADLAQEIRAAGQRVTPQRLQTLALLRRAASPVNHAEIEAALAQDSGHVDRVTLYRVLDWMVSVGLAHKAADARGVFRFSATLPNLEHSEHVHFRCTDCGGVFCLEAPRPVPPPLPKGFHLSGMDVDLRGECARCAIDH